jgi:membrane protein
MNKWKTILKTAALQWSKDNASRLSAAVAYYVVFSAAPVLVLVIALVGLVFGKDAAGGQITQMLSRYVSGQVAAMVQGAVASASKPGAGVAASLIGFVVLLFGASGALREMKSALNTIWGITLKEDVSWVTRIKGYLIPLILIPVLGGLLILLIAATAIVSAVVGQLDGFLPGLGFLVQAANLVVSFGLVMLLFATVFKMLPDTEIAWADVLVGSGITAFLFIIGEFLLSLYLRKGGMGSIYGAAGSLIVFLAWIYYSAQIFFLGAEITQAYSNQAGRKIRPKQEAETVVENIKRHYHLVEATERPA